MPRTSSTECTGRPSSPRGRRGGERWRQAHAITVNRLRADLGQIRPGRHTVRTCGCVGTLLREFGGWRWCASPGSPIGGSLP
jgi:hypothetical protein